MKNRTKSKQQSNKRTLLSNWTADPNILVFAGERKTAGGESIQTFAYRPVGLYDWADALFGRAKVEVKADWERVVDQIRFLLDEVSAATKDYELSEITFQLGFSAEGRIVFVAKGGVTTTITAKFTRK